MANDIANSDVPETVDRPNAVGSTNHDSVTMDAAVLRLIDRMCDEFETAWQTGDSPSIEKILSQVAADYRPTAFRELLLLDLEYGTDRGLNTSPEQYLQRFPEYSQTIRGTFAERDAAQIETHGSGMRARPLFNVPPQLGDYELLQEIGRGGMGVVYKSRQISLDRIVALKLIRVEGFLAEEAMRRFQTEARAAARMQHPGIVQIYEIGQDGPWHFFSMEYIEGRTLANVCSDGPLSSVEAARSLITLATAVQHAHDNGILHRDLKPSNILVDKTGRLRIADFGIAKQTEGSGTMTSIGQILGTPGYMSPEQARGGHDRIDCRCDVYSLGAVLYALITQRPPFQGRSPIDTLVHVLHDRPRPPHEWNPAVDLGLERICLKCMNKDPAERYASATALREALEDYLAQPTSALNEILRVDEPVTSKGSTEDNVSRSRRTKHAVLLILVTGFVIGAVSMGWRQLSRLGSTDDTSSLVAASDSSANPAPVSKPIDQTIKLAPGPGALDPSFGEGGIARVEFGHGGMQLPYTLALQSDGKLVAAGQVTRKRDTFYMSVARYLPDGRLDPTFNTTGKMLLWIGVFDDGINARTLQIQEDGKIILGGRAEVSAIGYDFALVRICPDGSMDTTFGEKGIVTTNVTGIRSSALQGLALQPDGKIIAAGVGMIEPENAAFIVARYLADGSLDDGFGNRGYVTVDLPGTKEFVTHTILGQDGKIVVVGEAAGKGGFDLIVLRRNSDGTPDESFGAGGGVVLDFAETDDLADTVAIQQSKLIVHVMSDGRHFLLRLNADGSIDPTFGQNGDGKVNSEYPIAGFVLTPAGEIVVANANEHRVTVLSADGIRCATFDARNAGEEASRPRYSWRDMVREPNGKLVFCGWMPGELEGTSNWVLMRLLGPPETSCK